MTTTINPLYVVDSGSGGGGGVVTSYGTLTATATGATASRTGADRAADVWSLKDFTGVVADGTTAGAGTDNATGFAAAITAANALYAASGNPIILDGGNGCYALGSSVAMKAGVTIRNGTYVVKNASTYATAMHSLFTASGISDIAFINCTAWGVGPDRKLAGPCTDVATLAGRDSFVDIDACTNITITGCTLFRFQNAVLISKSFSCRFIGNYINSLSAKTVAQIDNGTYTPYSFTGDPGGGIRVLGERAGINQTESDGFVISSNVIICVGLDIAIDCTSQSGYPFRAQVVGNYCSGCNSGIQVYTSGVAVPDPGTLTTTDRAVNISSNHIVWTIQQGIYIRGVEGVQCTGNKVTRCATIGTFVGTSAGGILCRSSTISTFPTSPVAHDLPVMISGNQVIDCGDPSTGNCDAGIRCDTPHSSVIGNQIVRSLDRFPTTLLSGSSFGILAVTTGGADQWKTAIVKDNMIRGFATGISGSYPIAGQYGAITAIIEGNMIAATNTGINFNTKSSGLRILGNTISETTNVGIYLKNTPFSSISRNQIEGVPIGIQLDVGNNASDYWVTGGRQGQTLLVDDNIINGATTNPFSILNTATGDISVISRCISCERNIVDNSRFYRDSVSFTATATPTASNYHNWQIGETIHHRNPTTATASGWVCNVAGTFGPAVSQTATTTSGSATVTFSALAPIAPGAYITIAGVTGVKKILSVNVGAFTAVMDTTASASVSGAAVAFSAPTFLTIANYV